MIISAKLDYHFKEYEKFHRHPRNKMTHYIGVPLILFSVLGLLNHMPYGFFVVAFVILWYLSLDWKLTLPYGLFLILMYWISGFLKVPVLLALFLIGWVIQLIGHSYYEKNKPAFFTSLTHLLMGPFWIFAQLMPIAKSPKI